MGFFPHQIHHVQPLAALRRLRLRAQRARQLRQHGAALLPWRATGGAAAGSLWSNKNQGKTGKNWWNIWRNGGKIWRNLVNHSSTSSTSSTLSEWWKKSSTMVQVCLRKRPRNAEKMSFSEWKLPVESIWMVLYPCSGIYTVRFWSRVGIKKTLLIGQLHIYYRDCLSENVRKHKISWCACSPGKSMATVRNFRCIPSFWKRWTLEKIVSLKSPAASW